MPTIHFCAYGESDEFPTAHTKCGKEVAKEDTEWSLLDFVLHRNLGCTKDFCRDCLDCAIRENIDGIAYHKAWLIAARELFDLADDYEGTPNKE